MSENRSSRRGAWRFCAVGCLCAVLLGGCGISRSGSGGTTRGSAPRPQVREAGTPHVTDPTPTPRGSRVVTYDPLTNILEGPRSFGRRDSVRVLVTNVNPFLYQYRLRLLKQVLRETAPADFLRLALGFDFPVVSNVAPIDLAQAVTARGGAPTVLESLDFREWLDADPCRLVAIEADFNVAVERKDSAKAYFGQLESVAKRYRTGYEAQTKIVLNPASPAGRVYDAAEQVPPLARSFVNDAKPLLARTDTAAGRLSASVASLDNALFILPYESRVLECEDDYRKLRLGTDRLAADAVALRSGLATVRAAITDAEATEQRMGRVLSEHRTFWMERYVLGDREEASDVEAIIERRPQGADTTYLTLGSTKLNFGGGLRFAIGAGLSAAQFRSRSYGEQRVYLARPDGSAGDTVMSVVAVTGDSDMRTLPMVALHGQMYSWDTPSPLVPSSLHGVLAATVRRAEGNTDAEFFVGSGLGFINDWLVVSGGAYIGRQQRLGGGLAPGDRVPAGQAIPLVSRTAIGPALLLTFRLRPEMIRR